MIVLLVCSFHGKYLLREKVFQLSDLTMEFNNFYKIYYANKKIKFSYIYKDANKGIKTEFQI